MKPAFCLVALLAACAPGTDPGTFIAREAAKTVVLPIVSQRLPGPQAERVAICVIDNASAAEINALARDVGTRAGTSTIATVAGILQRPDTVQCVLGAGIPGLSL